MKNVLKVLDTNEKDNVLTAYAKGGFKGLIGFVTVATPVLSTIYLIGKVVINKDELKKFEGESGAE
jgi:hypothetical protein